VISRALVWDAVGEVLVGRDGEDAGVAEDPTKSRGCVMLRCWRLLAGDASTSAGVSVAAMMLGDAAS
jgi:hypothetical protein